MGKGTRWRWLTPLLFVLALLSWATLASAQTAFKAVVIPESETPVDDAVILFDGTFFRVKVLPNCPDSGGNHLNYVTSTNTFSCGTSGGGGGTDFTVNPFVAGQQVSLTGDISPTQIAANTDDYNPTGLSTASTLRLSTDASRNLTGITGGADGRLLIVHNVGAFDLVLKNDVTSTAANRFLFGSDLTMSANTSVVLRYDSTSSRWRRVASGTAAGGGTVTTFSIDPQSFDTANPTTTPAVTRKVINPIGALGATPTVNWNSGVYQSGTLSANAVFQTPTNPTPGQRYALILTQDATTARTVTWWGSVVWPGDGVAWTINAALSSTTLIEFFYDGTSYRVVQMVGGSVRATDYSSTGPDGPLTLPAIATPGTPATGDAFVYPDSTTKSLCLKDDAGAVKCYAPLISPSFTTPGAFGVFSMFGGDITLFGSTSGGVSLHVPAVVGGSFIVTVPSATDTLMGKATVDIVTNKTIDAEATGNVITIPAYWDLDLAACIGGTASHIWNTGIITAPTPGCGTGTNRVTGFVTFPDSDGPVGVFITKHLPTGWTGSFDADIWWKTTGTGNARFQIATKCYADDEADDVVFNTASIVTAAAGTSGRWNRQTITGIDTTGCAAEELMRIKFLRDRTEGSDNLNAALDVEKVVFKLRVAH